VEQGLANGLRRCRVEPSNLASRTPWGDVAWASTMLSLSAPYADAVLAP
jgi:hypothetical protein